MKTVLVIAFFSLSLSACATPTTTLQHPKSQDIVHCGGGTAGSIAGGMIGYSIQQDNDAECVKKHKASGYKVVKVTTTATAEE